MKFVAGVVPHLMGRPRRNPDSVTRAHDVAMPIHFHDGLAGKYVKELLRVMMEVSNLRRTWRHALLDHAQLRCLDQMPAIAALAPDVMLGG